LEAGLIYISISISISIYDVVGGRVEVERGAAGERGREVNSRYYYYYYYLCYYYYNNYHHHYY